VSAKRDDAIPPHRRVALVKAAEDNVVVARWPTRTLRFLFDDGATLDVRTDRDDSDLRGAVLAWAKKDRIEGVADMTVYNGDQTKPL
jgi:hypothetical protein